MEADKHGLRLGFNRDHYIPPPAYLQKYRPRRAEPLLKPRTYFVLIYKWRHSTPEVKRKARAGFAREWYSKNYKWKLERLRGEV